MSFLHIDTTINHSARKDNLLLLDRLVSEAKKNKMKALGMAEYKTMYKAFDFYKLCQEKGINPLLGLRVPFEEEGVELLLIAQNYKGYQCLSQLSSELNGMLLEEEGHGSALGKRTAGYDDLDKDVAVVVYLDGYFKQMMEEKKKAEGSVYTEGGAGRLIQSFLAAKKGEGIYFALTDHGLAHQKEKNQFLRQLKTAQNGGEPALKLIASNEVKYHEARQAKATQMWCKINHVPYEETEEQYFKTAEEMSLLFSEEELQHTIELAESCQVVIPRRSANMQMESKIPDIYTERDIQIPETVWKMFDYEEDYFSPPENKQKIIQIAHLIGEAYAGLIREYGEDVTADLTKRAYEQMRKELGVNISKDFHKYFLLVQKFVKFIKQERIPFGPGRGSAPSAILSYALGITDLCPLRFGFVFERFLHIKSKKFPDIDLDIGAKRRPEVFQYAQSEFGKEYVAKIIAHNTYGLSFAMRDVAKQMNVEARQAKMKEMPISEKDLRVLKKFIQDSTTLTETDELKKMMMERKEIEELLYHAKELCVLVSTPSIHSSGVIISNVPLYTEIPLMLKKEAESNQWIYVTQYADDAGQIEDLGFTKLDLLSSRILDIRGETMQEVGLDSIPRGDQKTFSMIQSGEVVGGFQVDSESMQKTCKQIKPTNIEELNDVVSIYRPGPMAGIPRYVAEKFRHKLDDFTQEDPTYEVLRNHEELKPLFDQTYGVIIYQEQVMNLVKTWSGYSLSDADKFRQLIKKKDVEGFEKEIAIFKEKAKEFNRDETLTEKLIEIIQKFAAYGYNLSHGASYAVVTYETLYLKAHYPEVYFKNLLNHCADDKKMKKKTALYLKEAKKIMDLRPPHINRSNANFELVEGGLEFGLKLIKGMGERDVQEIVQARDKAPFLSIQDFMNRTSGLKPKVVEALAKAGAFDSLGKRKDILSYLENPQEGNKSVLPGFFLIEGYKPDLKTQEDFSSSQIKFMEEEVMSTSFVTTEYEQHYKHLNFIKVYNEESPPREFVEIMSVRKHVTPKKAEMAYLTLQSGKKTVGDVVCFPSQWEKQPVEENGVYLFSMQEKNGQWIVRSAQQVREVHLLLTDQQTAYESVSKEVLLNEVVYAIGWVKGNERKTKYISKESYHSFLKEKHNHKLISIRL